MPHISLALLLLLPPFLYREFFARIAAALRRLYCEERE
jgi:hypothetical protein